MLYSFGAVTGRAGRPVLTPLGRWARHRLEAASGWLEQHHPREILEAAESMPPLLRTVAADLVMALGEDAIPAWREFAAAPHVGPHARFALYAWEQEPEPDERDLRWLAAESAAAALDGKGPDEALCVLWESVRGEGLAGRLAVCAGPAILLPGNWSAR